MTRSTLRITLLAFVSVTVGLGIVIAMMWMAHIHLKPLLQSLEHARPAPLVAVVLATLLHLWITSLKWRLVTEVAGEAERLRGSFFGYTAVSALVGQFVPQQIAAVTVRTLAGRMHQRTPVTRAAGLAIFDQLIDLLPPAALLAPALLCLTHKLDPWMGALIAGITLVTVAAFLPKALKAIAALASHARGFLPAAIRSNLRSAPLPGGSTLSKLFALSIIRFLNLTVRYYLLALCVGAPISMTTIVEATPVITLIFLFAITPGALGLAELGWVGVLTAAGLSPAAALEYSISSRIVTFACVVAITVAALIAAAVFNPWRARGNTVELAGTHK